MPADDPLHAATQPNLAPDEAALRDELWPALPERLGPLAAEADQSDVTNQELVGVLRDLGLFQHFLPTSHGGLGLSIVKICLIREALAYQSVAADEFFASQGVTVQPILMWGTPAQRDEYLDGLLSGRRLYAFCLTEPGAGSDVRGIATSARVRRPTAGCSTVRSASSTRATPPTPSSSWPAPATSDPAG